MSQRAVVCLSGGLDSTVTLAIAAQEYEICALHMSYGQKTAERERRAFDAVCDHYDVAERLVVPQPALGIIGGSALTDPGIEIPMQEPGAGIPVTYVPFRNGQILAAACAWAEVLGAHAVYMGAVEEDSSGYPDCRESFFTAFEAAVREGTRPESSVRIVTPLLHERKGQIVRRGVELGAPLSLSWSCYGESELACGECESCRLRLAAFESAGVADAIAYRDSNSR
jgi:7-cyano-7-deazaguanine synthase